MLRKIAFAGACALFLLQGAASAADVQSVDARRLESLIGQSPAKLVLVTFWATWCGACLDEVPGLIRLRQEFSPQDLEIIGLSLDYNRKELSRFVARAGISYPVYVATQDLLSTYSIVSIPRLLVYRNGRVALDQEGYVPEKSLRQVIKLLLGK